MTYVILVLVYLPSYGYFSKSLMCISSTEVILVPPFILEALDPWSVETKKESYNILSNKLTLMIFV